MKKIYVGKNVIVTGGSGGIGSTVVASFLGEGAKVLTLGKEKNQLRKPLIGVSAMQIDVSDRNQLKKVGEYIKERFSGRVDVLVNAAGIYGPKGNLEELDLDFWEKTVQVNLMGTVNMCALVIPFMKTAGRGKIINFSGGGDSAFPKFTAYSSSKGAVIRFTESLAAELAEDNIFVNAVAPGPVNTALVEEVLNAGPGKVGRVFYLASKKQKAEGGISPGLASDLILFLASENSGNLKGKIISAVHDEWKNIPKHLGVLSKTDIYNNRRIKPKDRGYDW